MGFSTVLFDFDGTLANTNQVVLDSWQHTYEARWGHKVDEERIIKSFGEPLRETMAREFPEYDLDETVAIYSDFQKEIFADVISPFDGMDELVKNLHEAGIKVALVTSRVKSSTDVGVDTFGLRGYLDCIITAEDTEIHKPYPDPVLAALKKLDAKPEDALMIGDSVMDIMSASRAGVKTVLVSWTETISDYRSLEGEKKPTYFVESPEEIYELAIRG